MEKHASYSKEHNSLITVHLICISGMYWNIVGIIASKNVERKKLKMHAHQGKNRQMHASFNSAYHSLFK